MDIFIIFTFILIICIMLQAVRDGWIYKPKHSSDLERDLTWTVMWISTILSSPCTRSMPWRHSQVSFIWNLQATWSRGITVEIPSSQTSDELPGNTHVDMGSMMTNTGMEDFSVNGRVITWQKQQFGTLRIFKWLHRLWLQLRSQWLPAKNHG